MSDTAPSDLPTTLQLPSELAFLANPISNYFEAKPPYNNARLSALIYTPPPQPPRLFLAQLSGSTDPNAFSTAWNVPHDFPQPSDASLLHALTRIVSQQTGMQLHSVRAMAGSEIIGPDHPLLNGPQWMKLLFTVEVEELQPFHDPISSTSQTGSGMPEDEALTAGLPDYRSVLISLDTRMYRQYTWVTKAEFQEFLTAGLYPHWEKAQYELMLNAFDLLHQSPSETATSSSHSPDEPPFEPPPKPPSPAGPRRTASVSGHKRSATSTGITKPKRSQSRTPKLKQSNSSFFHRFSIREGKK